MNEPLSSNQEETSQVTFESAFQRIDELLKKLNSAETPLEEALQHYEEADKLIALCSQRLNSAERRIEKLVKQRSGVIDYDAQGRPKTEPITIA